MSERDPHDIIRLRTASNSVEAGIWRSALEDENIPCRVVGDLLDAGLGDVGSLRAELWVHREDAERAEQVLEQRQPLAEDESVEQEPSA